MPYGRIINCGHDTVKEILEHLWSNIDGSTVQAKDHQWKEKGVLYKFDQTEFVEAWPFEYTGFDDNGYVFYPNQCVDGVTKCKLVVMMHGAF